MKSLAHLLENKWYKELYLRSESQIYPPPKKISISFSLKDYNTPEMFWKFHIKIFIWTTHYKAKLQSSNHSIWGIKSFPFSMR